MMDKISLNQLNVMLVEPSKTQSRFIRDCLNKFNVENIKYEEEGIQAISDMREQLPHLVISAMYLPDMTGTELIESMRAIEELKHVPYMLISSETSIRALDPIRQAGAVAILPKPFEPLQLKRALYTTIDFLEPETIDLDSSFANELKVLIVDDSKVARGHIRKTLRGFGIEQISEAENGREAASLVEENIYDIIVTDYHMPEMNGNELVSHIRSKGLQKDIPILMVTSEMDTSRLAAVDHTGVSALCNKPFEPNTIKSLLQKLL